MNTRLQREEGGKKTRANILQLDPAIAAGWAIGASYCFRLCGLNLKMSAVAALQRFIQLDLLNPL